VPSLQSYKVNFIFICKHNLCLILLHTFRDSVLLALAKDNVTFKPTVDSPKNLIGRYFWTCLSVFTQELLLGWCNSKGGGSVRVTRIQRQRNGRRNKTPTQLLPAQVQCRPVSKHCQVFQWIILSRRSWQSYRPVAS